VAMLDPRVQEFDSLQVIQEPTSQQLLTWVADRVPEVRHPVIEDFVVNFL
jgi:hypothetical protein